MSYNHHFLIFFILTFNIVTLYGQNLNTINYNVSEGLPQSQVFTISEDHEGYIWSGTQGGGLSKFDGLEFTYLNAYKEFEDNFINTILKGVSSDMYIGSSKGLYHYYQDTFIKLNIPNHKDISINTLALINKELHIGTSKGYYIYETKSEEFSQQINNNLSNKHIIKIKQINQHLLVGTYSGLYIQNVNTKEWLKITQKEGLLSNEINDFAIGKNQNIWVSCYKGGLSILDPNNFKVIQEINPLLINQPICLLKKDNNIFVGTRNKGLSKFDILSDTWTTYNEGNGLDHNYVKTLYKDSRQNIWIGFSGGGFSRILKQNFVHFNTKNGLNNSRVYAVAQDQSNGLWLSAGNKGISFKKDNKITHYNGSNGFLDVKCRALLVDDQERLWVGTADKGIIIKDSIGFHPIGLAEGLPGLNIRSLTLDKKGDIWAAIFDKGIVQIRELDSLNFGINTFDRKDGLFDLSINTLITRNKEEIWFTTFYGKVGLIKNSEIEAVYSHENGLPNTSIRSIAFDKSGHVWIATAGQGLYYATLNEDTIQFKAYKNNNKLSSRNIYLMTFDHEGHLWIGNEKGVDELIYPNEPERSTVKKHRKEEGFKGIETCQNAVVTGDDKSIWFGTLGGLTKYSRNENIQKQNPPYIHIESIENNNSLVPFQSNEGQMDFNYDKNNFEFVLKGIHLNKPKDLYYKWKLDGLNNSYSKSTKNKSIFFSNLQPGKYHFEAQACLNTICSDKAEYYFEINAPFWQKSWFIWCSILGLIGLISLFIWQRLNKLKKKSKAVQEQLKMDNELLKLEQKARQLQMNPHFIFNALNSIQSLMAVEDAQSARKQLSKFARLMRNILNQSKMDTITLEDEAASLQTYLEIEQYCRPGKFDFNINYTSSNNINIDDIEFPPMILQPFVENAVIHGVSHLEKGGQIDINFILRGKILECQIKDNGVGRERASILRAKKTPTHQSLSMEVTLERLENLKGKERFKAFEINDRLTVDGENCGTETIIRILLDQ